MERNELYVYLKHIKSRQFRLNEFDSLWNLTLVMIEHIGDPDAELRDDLIFTAFYYWILKHAYYTHQEMINLITRLIKDDVMFESIGTSDDDSVFKRSFSVLTLSVLLAYHVENPFLDQKTFRQVKDSLLRYCHLERDFRGFIHLKGWAHSVAHAADALKALVECQESDVKTHEAVLEAIEKMLFNDTVILKYKEDDRCAKTIYQIYKRQLLSNDILIAWMTYVYNKCSFNHTQNQYASSVNFRNVLRSVYFICKHHDSDTVITEACLDLERKLNAAIKG